MDWKCSSCGEFNLSDTVQCPCGFEDVDEAKPAQKDNNFEAFTNLNVCPECNSTSIKKFNTFDTGKNASSLH